MANFDAIIKLVVQSQEALREVKKLETALKKVGSVDTQKQLKKVANAQKSEARAAEGRASTEIKINAAIKRRETLLKSLNRAGVSGARAEEVQNLEKIARAAKGQLSIQNAVNAELTRTLEIQREINRTDRARSANQSKVLTDVKKRIELLKAVGATESEIGKVTKKRDEAIQRNSEKQTDLAKESFAQLDRQLSTLERKYKTFLGKPGRQLASSLSDAPKRTVLGSTEALKQQTQYIERAANAAKKGGFAATPLSQGDRFRSVLGSEKSLKQKEAYYKRIAREAERAAKADERAAKAAERAARAAGKRVDKVSQQQKKGSGRIGAAAIGAGFPLLFGGGPGSVLGGLIGGAAGGKENGFAASVALSAVGQILDRLATSAGNLGKALLKPTTNIDKLVESLGIAGTGLNSSIEVLRQLGLESVASAVAVDKFNEKYGKGTADSLRVLGERFQELQNSISQLGVRLAAFISGPLGGLFDFFSNVLGSASNAEAARVLQNNVSEENRGKFTQRLNELTGGRGFSGTISDDNLKTLINEFDPEAEKAAKAREKAEKAISDEIARQVELAQLSAEIEESKLTNRRDVQAVLAGTLAVQEASNEIEKLNLQIANETEATKLRLLGLEKDLAEERKRQAEAARENARIQAEVAIRKEVLALENQIDQTQQQRYSTALKSAELQESEATTFARRLSLEDINFDLKKKQLERQRESQLLLVNEEEKIRAINLLFSAQLAALEEKRDVNKEIIRQNEVLRQDAQKAVEDQLKLNALQAANNADREIRATDPSRIGEFLGSGFGFFDQSNRFESDRLAESAATLEIYNEQVGALQQRITKLQNQGVDPDKLLPLENQLASLTQTRDLYAELQPRIDAAAIAQARYNDAFNAINPIVQSFTGNLQEVVAGTKSAEQAFADFLRTIADMLVQTAAQMIAQFLAIAAAQSLVGLGGGGGKLPLPGLKGAPSGFAEGGRPPVGAVSIVGERGPELFVPDQPGRIISNRDSKSAMARYTPANSIEELAMQGGGRGKSDWGYSTEDSYQPVINISTGNTLQFEGRNYVTQEEFQAGVSKAAVEGAKAGEARTLRRLRMSPGARRNVGF